MQKFTKNDKDKVRMELLDPDFIIGTAEVLTFGAKKYEAENWKKATGKDIARYEGAILRHLMAYRKGEKIDPETGLSHLYHISCNTMFLAYFDRHRTENIGQTHIKFSDNDDGDINAGCSVWGCLK